MEGGLRALLTMSEYSEIYRRLAGGQDYSDPSLFHKDMNRYEALTREVNEKIGYKGHGTHDIHMHLHTLDRAREVTPASGGGMTQVAHRLKAEKDLKEAQRVHDEFRRHTGL